MSTPELAASPARLLPELGSAEPVELAAAPIAPEPERGWMAALLPAVGALGMLGFALLSPSVWVIALCGAIAILSAGAAVWSARQQRRRSQRQWRVRRERYLAHLAGCVKILAEAAERQREYALTAHPGFATARPGSGGREIWSRRPWHEDFLHVRLGIGRVPARRQPRLQGASGDPDGEPELLKLAAAVVARHCAVDDIPVTIDLAAAPHRVVVFDQWAQLRAVVLTLAGAHGPDVIRIDALTSPAESRWLADLPHSVSVSTDPAGWIDALRRQLRDRRVTAAALPSPEDDEYKTTHHVLVLGAGHESTRQALQAFAGELPPGPGGGVCVLAHLPPYVYTPTQVTARIRTDPDGGCVVAGQGDQPWLVSVAGPDVLSYNQALQFATVLGDLGRMRAKRALAPATVQLAELLESKPRHPLSIPIGQDEEGLAVTVDLREAAAGGDGPHGLVIGSTGTGKSELLRTLLTAAAAQSSPEELVFLLVDFKGGAAFTELAGLPHTAGLLTNLNSDAQEINRFCAAVRAELRRRQRVLRDAGADNIDAFHSQPHLQRRAPALPRLLLVVDEYAELIEESPDVLDVLMSVGRLGRSLGIHLFLASQRLDDGRLRGLDAHLRFRICLRTSSPAESVAVLGVAHAARLPSAPGWAWLRRDGALAKVRVALAGAATEQVLAAARGNRALPVCLPPLPELLTLDSVNELAGSSAKPAAWAASVGLVDLPEHGRQEALVHDLAGAAGHLAVIGAPRTGRSTALASLVVALADSTPPRDLAVHIVTTASGPLLATAGLPQVGTVATTAELGTRVVRAVADQVAERQSRSSQQRAYEPRLLLVIDDVAAVMRWGDDIAEQLAAVANVGLSVGVSLAVSCHTWSELRSLRPAIASTWELRLNDPSDSGHPRQARQLTRLIPGRIITGDGAWAQLALPMRDGLAVDDIAGIEDAVQATSELVAEIARRGGPATRPVLLLPTRVSACSLPPPLTPDGVVIGVAGTFGQPVEIGLAAGQHFIVLGNGGSGRSGLLRAIASATGRRSAAVWRVDPRRTSSAIDPSPYRSASSAEEVGRLIAKLSRALEQGQECNDPLHHVLVIDDLDLAAGFGRSSSFTPLVELLPYASDLGLSVVAARRVSGSSRAAYDPFYGRLLELCETSLLLSGDPSEGPVIGGLRPSFRPPGRGVLIRHGESAGEIQAVWLDDCPQKPHPARNCSPQPHPEPCQGM